MCMADITIGRKSWVRTSRKGDGDTILADPKRVCVIIAINGVAATPGVFSISALSSGVMVPIASISKSCTTAVARIEDYGQSIIQQLVVQDFDGTGETIGVTEVFMNDVEESEPEE